MSAPDRTAKVDFYNLGRDPNTVAATDEGAFVWTIQDERGMYILDDYRPLRTMTAATATAEWKIRPKRVPGALTAN